MGKSPKRYTLVVAMLTLGFLLVSCGGRAARTDNWQIRVTEAVRVGSEHDVVELLKSRGIPDLTCCRQAGPYLAVSVELKNISGRIQEYPGLLFGTFDAFVIDSQGEVYHGSEWGWTGVERQGKSCNYGGCQPLTVLPDATVTDVYVFAVPPNASDLQLRLAEGWTPEWKEALIPLDE